MIELPIWLMLILAVCCVVLTACAVAMTWFNCLERHAMAECNWSYAERAQRGTKKPTPT